MTKVFFSWDGRDGLKLAAAYSRNVNAWELHVSHPQDPTARVELWTLDQLLQRARALGAEVQL